MRLRPTLLPLPLLLLAACSEPTPPADAVPASSANPVPDAAAAATASDHAPPAPPQPPPIPPAAGDLGTLATTTDTLDSLRDRHGPGNVVEAALPLGGGSEEPGWMLFGDDAERVVMIHLDSLGQPTHLALGGESSVWSVQGVRVGMPLPELQALNGGPLAVAGFRANEPGLVIDWRGGSLDGRGVIVRLCMPDGAIPANYPQGAQPFASDDPRVAVLVPTVCNLGQQIGPTAGR